MRSAWLAVLFVPLSCKDPTEITIAVSTDVPCAHVTETSIAVGGLGLPDDKPPTALSTICEGGTLGALVVVPSGDKNAELVVRVVTGLNGQRADACVASGYKGGCIVARRALHFQPSHAVKLPIVMNGSCRDVACSPDKTCADGVCVSSESVCEGDSCGVTSGDAGPPPATPTHWTAMPPLPSDIPYKPLVPGRTVWTGSEMIVWGSYNGGDGVAFAPATNTWRYIPPSLLSPRKSFAMVWAPTAGKVVIFGGEGAQDGALYDPAGSWAPMKAPPPAFTAQYGSAAVWSTTTGEVLFFGGQAAGGALDATAAAYDPAADRWRMIAQSPLSARDAHGAVWSGDRMVVFGGYYSGGAADKASYATYDPVTDTWGPETFSSLPARANQIAVASPQGAIFWGGRATDFTPYANGAIVDASGASSVISEPFPAVLPNNARWNAGGWFSNGRLWVFGGSDGMTAANVDNAYGTGAYYDLATQAWTAMPSDGAPSPRTSPAVVWTGSEAIVWSGFSGQVDPNGLGIVLLDGAIFGP